MGSWRVSVDLLAASRFTPSPMAECVAALTVLQAPAGPWQQTFHASNHVAFEAMLAEHPVRQQLARRVWRPRRGDQPGWGADFRGVVPARVGMSFQEELELLAAEWHDEHIRRELHTMWGKIPPLLQGAALLPELLELLGWIWATTLAADWPRRERVLRADIISRTNLLATRGWSGVLPSLGPGRQWLGDGRLQINGYDLPDRDIQQAEQLFFIPVHSNSAWVAWAPPRRYALIYPVTGALAPPDSPAPAGLTRLIGPGRARLLELLADPHTTTQLAAVSGLPLGSVGNHLKVMLHAGLVLRRRSGREVLYWRTALGDSLTAATAPTTPPATG